MGEIIFTLRSGNHNALKAIEYLSTFKGWIFLLGVRKLHEKDPYMDELIDSPEDNL